MAIIEVKPVIYKDEQGKDIRFRVTFNNHVLALFTSEESANKFVNSHLCEVLINHLGSDNIDMNPGLTD